MPPSGLASLTTSSWRPAGAARKPKTSRTHCPATATGSWRGCLPEERRVAEIMFRRLVEVEDHSNRLRRPTQCGTVARLAQVSLEVVQRVVDAFRAEDASFIYASRRRAIDDTSIDIMMRSLDPAVGHPGPLGAPREGVIRGLQRPVPRGATDGRRGGNIAHGACAVAGAALAARGAADAPVGAALRWRLRRRDPVSHGERRGGRAAATGAERG